MRHNYLHDLKCYVCALRILIIREELLKQPDVTRWEIQAHSIKRLEIGMVGVRSIQAMEKAERTASGGKSRSRSLLIGFGLSTMRC